jgi:hypothetical protein
MQRPLACRKRLATAYVTLYARIMHRDIMPKKLDYRTVWTDARNMFAADTDAIVAIAGFFIFLAAWISGFLVPPLMIDTLENADTAVATLSAYFEANWLILLPTMMVTMYGSLSLYVLLSGRALAKVGDALGIAAALFVPYLLASILVGWATLAGFFLLVIPGLYLSGRFALLPAVMAGGGSHGVHASVIRTWHVTRHCGWAILMLMLFVALAARIASGIVGGAVYAVCQSIAGADGIPILQSGVSAFFATLEAVAVIVILVAINRQLVAQTPHQ